MGTPVPGGGALVRLGHSLVHVKIWVHGTLRGRNMVFWKSWFRCVWFQHLISVISGLKFTKLLSPNARGIVVQNVLVWFWISSSVPEIFAIELWPNFACFWSLKFFGGGPPKFWTGIINFRLVLISVQNFAPIGRRISEVSRWNKKTSRVKHKPALKAIASGRTIIKILFLPNFSYICLSKQ